MTFATIYNPATPSPVQQNYGNVDTFKGNFQNLQCTTECTQE